jgi:ATP-dependent helicase/nuclease subunit B
VWPVSGAPGSLRWLKMERVFLDWVGAPLPKAAEWLVEQLGSDLGGVVVALPGARSGRILEELLARQVGAGLVPPKVVTAGVLSDELLEVEGAAAPRLVRTLAWEKSLRQLPTSDLTRIVPRPPAADDRVGWATLAEEVRGLFGEVAAEGLDFGAVAKSPLLAELEGERARWRALGQAQESMSELLRAAGLHDPHLGRLAAIEAGRVRQPRRVVLVGVLEMNELLRRSLGLCQAEQTALVFAPGAEREGFDGEGCLIPTQWENRQTSLTLEQWHVVDRPADQAEQVARILAGWGREVSAEQVTIGLADPGVSPYLKSRLAEAGLRARDAAGTPMARTAAVRLLAAVAEFLRSTSFRTFSALVRHPDFERALLSMAGGCEPIDVLDDYHGKHLPWRVDGDWSAEKDDKRDQALRARMEVVWRGAREVLGELTNSKSGSAGEHAHALRTFLRDVYGTRQLDPGGPGDRLLIASLRCLAAGLVELTEVPEGLAPEGDLADTIDLLLRLVSNKGNDLAPTGARPGEPTIEMMGWLELPLDDAPALVVTGFEDGKVPESVRGDAYLPDRLRRDLGLVDNARRLARDLYATELLLRSRERVAFISGRRSLAGDPQVPSRVVFHCSDEQVAPRVRRFLAGGAGPAARVESAEEAGRALPRGAALPPPEVITVSAFKTFLEAPYAYYLKHVLKLDTQDDDARELDGAAFGNLAHGVLQRFGQDERARDLRDPEKITAFLISSLGELGAELYGRRPLPAVQLQLQQLELRLGTFARKQAEQRGKGWRIHAVEWSPEGGTVDMLVDGTPIQLKGRIDRIDRHETSGEWAIWDYKTGDKVKQPLNAHRRKDGTWRDLQLPLYCQLVVELLGDRRPEALGYIAIGSDEKHTGFWSVNDWRVSKNEFDDSDEALQLAYGVAHDIVRRIRAGDTFDVTGWRPYDEVFKAIGGVGLVASADASMDDGEEGGQ